MLVFHCVMTSKLVRIVVCFPPLEALMLTFPTIKAGPQGGGI